MLNSILLHLERSEQAESIIRLGVSLASPVEARVRGLTLLDTRHVESALTCESAVYAVMEQDRQASLERQQESLRVLLSQACLDAGLNFDIRRATGSPFEVLPREARFHDLVITSAMASGERGRAGGLSSRELISLLERGVRPLLVVRSDQREINRVLLTYDGSEASGRAIRSYLNLHVFPQAEYRLLAIGRNEQHARASLREMAEYCVRHHPALETGCAVGRTCRVVLPYAQSWDADLTVLGEQRGNRILGRLLGNTAADLWKKLSCGLYVTT